MRNQAQTKTADRERSDRYAVPALCRPLLKQFLKRSLVQLRIATTTLFLLGFAMHAAAQSGPGGVPNQLQLNNSGTSFGGAALYDNGAALNPRESLSFSSDPTGTKVEIRNANDKYAVDPAAFGGSYLTDIAAISSLSSNTITTTTAHSFVVNNGVAIAHGAGIGTLGGVSLANITPPTPSIQYGQCDTPGMVNSPYVASAKWQQDIGAFYQWNMEPLVQAAPAISGRYADSSGSFSFYDTYTPVSFCYATSAIGSSHTLGIKVAMLDGLGGTTAAVAATPLAANWVFPTLTHPALFDWRAPDWAAGTFALKTVINPRSNNANLPISSIAYSGGVVTVSLASPMSNPFAAGQRVTISGVIGPYNGAYGNNGTYPILASPAATTTSFSYTDANGAVCNSWNTCGQVQGNNWYVITGAGSASAPPNWMSSQGCPGVGTSCTGGGGETYTNIGIPSFALWVSVDGGAYNYERVVWSDNPTVDLGTSTVDAGFTAAEWGNRGGGSWDIPNTPPSGAGLFNNDDLITTVTSVPDSTHMTLALAPNAGASGAIYHDSAPNFAWMLQWCASTPSHGCRIGLKPGTMRVSSIVTPANLSALSIDGQDPFASTLDMFGNGFSTLLGYGGGMCGGGVPTGGQIQVFAGGTDIWLKNLNIIGDNSAADCIIHGATHWLGTHVENVVFGVGAGSYMRRALRFPGSGGMIWGQFNGFYTDVTLDDSNGLYFGGPGYSSFNTVWPGVALYPQLQYCTFGMGPFTVSGAVFENAWNAVGPCNGSLAGGGYLQGYDINQIYDSDFADENTSNDASLIDAVGNGEVTTRGVILTLAGWGKVENGGNIVASGLGGTNAAAEIGCVWGQNKVLGSKLYADGLNCDGSMFGIVADGMLTAVHNEFGGLRSANSGIPLSGTGIATYAPGADVEDNIVQFGGSGNPTGVVGYLIGWNTNDVNLGCISGSDPYTVRFNQGASYSSSLNTTLKACPTAMIEPGYQLAFAAPLNLGAGTNQITLAPNTRCTKQNILQTASGTDEFEKPLFIGQCELVRVCQAASGAVPSFTMGAGTTIPAGHGSFPTCATGANQCCNFELLFDGYDGNNYTAEITGQNGGPL